MSRIKSIVGFDSSLPRWVQVGAWLTAFAMSGVWIRVGFWPGFALMSVVLIALAVLRVIVRSP